MKRILLLFTLSFLSDSTFAGEFPFKVYNPSDAAPREQAETLTPYLTPEVKGLLQPFIEPQDSGFIIGSEGKETLQWRLSNATILSPGLVSLEFTEGHISVFGIYLRNDKEKRWDLHSEVYGKFRDRSVPDIKDESAPGKTE